MILMAQGKPVLADGYPPGWIGFFDDTEATHCQATTIAYETTTLYLHADLAGHEEGIRSLSFRVPQPIFENSSGAIIDIFWDCDQVSGTLADGVTLSWNSPRLPDLWTFYRSLGRIEILVLEMYWPGLDYIVPILDVEIVAADGSQEPGDALSQFIFNCAGSCECADCDLYGPYCSLGEQNPPADSTLSVPTQASFLMQGYRGCGRPQTFTGEVRVDGEVVQEFGAWGESRVEYTIPADRTYATVQVEVHAEVDGHGFDWEWPYSTDSAASEDESISAVKLLY
jgi:hypothetical protein